MPVDGTGIGFRCGGRISFLRWQNMIRSFPWSFLLHLFFPRSIHATVRNLFCSQPSLNLCPSASNSVGSTHSQKHAPLETLLQLHLSFTLWFFFVRDHILLQRRIHSCSSLHSISFYSCCKCDILQSCFFAVMNVRVQPGPKMHIDTPRKCKQMNIKIVFKMSFGLQQRQGYKVTLGNFCIKPIAHCLPAVSKQLYQYPLLAYQKLLV